MQKLRHRAARRNLSLEIDLFAWAAERDRRHRYSVAARIIARRCGITQSHAALVCTLAGIGGAE
jgi:hypothetical protein